MLTLTEAAKLNSGTVHEAALIEQYPRTSTVLQLMPFETIAGNAFSYNMEDKLPGVMFRGVNEKYDESTGIINPFTESLKISGGDLDVDRFLIDTMGQQQRAVQELMKVKALALYWTKTFFKGDSVASQHRQFDGLERRIVGSQLISAGGTQASPTAAAPTLAKLEEAIDAVDEPSVIYMNKSLIRGLNAAIRTSANVVIDKDAYGRMITTYNGIPILPIDKDENGDDIIGFNESGSTSSIYIVSFGADKIHGIQGSAAGSNGISVRDLGELELKPALRTRVEWYSAYAVRHGRAAARIYNITNAAWTV